MNARRLPVIAALGLLVAGGLVACRADPAVAAYVDDQRITEAEVDGVMAEVRPVVTDSAQLAVVRQQVVGMRVLTELAGRYAEQEGLAVPEPDRARIAAGLGLTPEHPYVQVVVDYQAVLEAVSGGLAPVPPTEADQRAVYDQLAAQGMTVPFEEVQPDLNEQTLGEPLALRDQLTELAGQAEIRLNPRYDPIHQLRVTVGNGEVGLGVPLAESVVVEAG